MPTPLPSSSAWLAFADAARHSSRRGARLRVIEAAGLRVDLTAQAHSDDLDSAAE
ncbi:glucose-6-phosphate isomerase, partial [Bordetella pertussis]